MNKLKLWKEDWDEAEQKWKERAHQASQQFPIKRLNVIPDMVGITPETAKFLKWKSLKWMVTQDTKKEVLKGFLKHPLRYTKAFLQSILKKKSFTRERDFFCYGVNSVNEFKTLLKEENTLIVLGFSYCHKPFECPSGRFTPDCIHDETHPVCQQCYIGKAVHAASSSPSIIPLFIPTVHYIGGKIFEIVHNNPNKQILFMITACEMTLEMFGDWGNMVNIKGLGIRLSGRICNTMKAFELSERGIKPGLTVILDETQEELLSLIRQVVAQDG